MPNASMTIRLFSAIALLSVALAGCGGGTSSTLPATPAAAPVPPDSEMPANSANISGDAVVASAQSSALSASQTQASAADVTAPAYGGDLYSSSVLADHPLAYYKLNDSSSQLNDSGVHRISGIYGAAVRHGLAPITQDGATAAGFPGGSSYNPNGLAYTRPNGSLQPGTLTVEAWVKINAASPANSHVPIAVYGNAPGVRYGLYVQGLGGNVDNIYYQQSNNGHGTLLFHGSLRLNVGVVYHLVTVFDGRSVTSYVNGLFDQTIAYPGTVNYPSGLTEGLQIGGQVPHGSSSAPSSFPGTIAQVAVYGSALSSQTVVNHYLAGQLVPLIDQTASQSDVFVDSFGIDVHFENDHSPYFEHFSQVKSLLAWSGIRHFRENMSFSPAFLSQMRELGQAGLHGDFITYLSSTENDVHRFPSLVAPAVEQFEAPNEQDDISGNTNWPPRCVAYEKSLYSWIKQYGATARYPLLGPGLAYAPNFSRIGNLSAYLDFGNFHDYMGGFNPGFLGGPWNGMKAMLQDELVTSGTKPVMVTEAGYGTLTGNPALDYRTHLRYMTRLFFEQFNAGISRTYSYEFLDEPLESGGFLTFGLVTNNLAPKPAFFGIKSLITELRDPGARFKPGSLTYSLSGLSTVHRLLLEKRNGKFILAVWLEVPSWKAAGGGDIIVPDQKVTLTTGRRFSSATVSTMGENGNMSTSTLPWAATRGTIDVSDKITLVTLSP